MIRVEHKEKKWAFPFVEYRPEHYEGKLPLILQLHGAGERGDGSDLTKVDLHGFSETIKGGRYNALFIMPQCPADSFWAARVESILRFIEQLKDEYILDENRIYLTGLSMGGFGTWYTAMARPQVFAAIAPVCGGGMAWNAGVLKMPIWAFHGDSDTVVSPNQSKEMAEALQNNKADVTFTLLKGVGHNAWDYAYNDTLLDWLLSHSK